MRVDPKKASVMQKELAKKVVIQKLKEKIITIAGVDVIAYENFVICSIVVFDYRTLKIIEHEYSVQQTDFLFIENLIGFRDTPVVIDAYNKLKSRPDLLFVDGNGILHPQRFGVASQIGVQLDIPTIGVAKSLLCGNVKNNNVFLDESKIGFEMHTKEKANPIYISPGHLINLDQSIEICKKIIIEPHKLPEPLHIAHKYAIQIKKRLKE